MGSYTQDELDRGEEIEYVLITEEIRKSRKVRQCAWCGIEIKVGGKYRRHVVKVEGEMHATVGCLDSPNCRYY